MDSPTSAETTRKATLPFELLSKIVSILVQTSSSDANSLLVLLSRTTRTLQAISESMLYHTLDISLASPKTAWKVVNALIPRRAVYIQRLSIYGLDGSVNNNTIPSSFYTVLGNSIGTFTNLTHFLMLDMPTQHTPHVLQHSLPRLRSFTSNILPSRTLAGFLTVNNIETLILPYGSNVLNSCLESQLDDFNLPEDALPRLQVIATRTNVIRRIVPQRPLRVVAVDYSTGGGQYTEATIPAFDDLLHTIGQSSAGVDTLSLHVRRAPGHIVVGDPAFPLFNHSSDLKIESVRTLEIYSTKKISELAPSLPNLSAAFPNAQDIQIECLTFPWWSETKAYLRTVASTLARRRVAFRDCGFSKMDNVFEERNDDDRERDSVERWKDKEDEKNMESFRRILARGLIWQ